MTEKTQDFVALRQILTEILGEICSLSDCQSVGIRLHDNGDYPYYVYEGFPDFFVLKENSVCARDDEDSLIFDEDNMPGYNPVGNEEKIGISCNHFHN